MAIDVSTYFVSINSVDLSSKCVSVGGLEQSREEQDITAFGDVIRQMQGTIEASPDLPLSFNQDFTGGSVHATISAIYTGKTAVAVDLRPTNAARSATNPSFTFTAKIPRYSPMDAASPGSILKASVTLRRTTAVTVQTS
jgi:phage tail sheath gpL-like